jgi:YD repeat-containing protein
MAQSLFSKGFLEQFILHAQFGEHLLQPPVLFLNGLRLGDHRRIHAPILRPPLLERRVTHTLRPAKLGHRHPAFSLTQDRKHLRLSVSACLHSESPHASGQENSTHPAPYFRGGVPSHSTFIGKNTCNRVTSVVVSATDTYTCPCTSNRLSSINLAAGGTRAYTNDGAGNVLTDSRGAGYSYTYDATGRRASMSINGVLQGTYRYDFAVRQTIRAIASTGVTIHSVFDAQGRRIAEYGEGSETAPWKHFSM